MPVYEYRCPKCRTAFELIRPMSESSDAATCPKGHAGAERVVSLVASFARMEGEALSNGGGGCACGGGSCGCGR